ncbi:helix-turn-helix domain-containing protein [Olsenella uli]|uniref:helix-turn-helix domain-containing protein n=1 Tax=Olsenella uli TaxID=133926 RepID=UPI001956550E|nr:helix-turn-helix transcriptional regulator [Olsenella uli]MBM6816531.1 helix-turn-helix domain-containing protein [Olsenella uli]
MRETINIGRTIARERRRRGVTQETLAAHLSVSKAAVSKWELGQSLPDVSLLPRIAAYFSLSLDELFDWRDELTQEESAALYAEVYALGEKDLAAAHERLRELAAAHYSDVNLLLMLASLLTVWAAGMATPFAPAGEKDGALEAAALTDEALALLDRVLELSTDPSTLYLAQQQKATTLFQAERHEEAAALLEPLVRRQDAGAPTMLLASAYRKLGRDDDALDLLQAERLRAASFVLSSLMQEVGMRGDAAFARAAGDAAEAVFAALGMGAVNPFFSATMAFEVAETLRRAGEKDEALAALARAVDAVAADPAGPDPSDSPLWDRMAGRLDPARAGEAWAEHKARQLDDLRRALLQQAAERVTSPEWRDLAGDDPRYQEIVDAATRPSGEEATSR